MYFSCHKYVQILKKIKGKHLMFLTSFFVILPLLDVAVTLPTFWNLFIVMVSKASFSFNSLRELD